MINTIEKTYNLQNQFNGYKMTLDNGTFTFVPLDPANSDYQAIMEYIENGGVVIDNGGGE